MKRILSFGVGVAAWCLGMPVSMASGAASNSTVRFDASTAVEYLATRVISNDSPFASYTLNPTGSSYQLTTNIGPYAGGNTITITNGSFGNITNVLVGGVRATLGANGATWFTIMLPATGSAGVKDIVVQTSDNGDVTLAGAYTVNPAGWIGRTDYGPNVWTNLGDGLNKDVWALAHDGKNLYAGGSFTTAGGVPAANVAKWDAASGAWTNLGAGMNKEVRALAYDGTNLYAGGDFTNAGGVSANYVAKWNGTCWTNLGIGVAGGVNVLACDGTKLYVGGAFTTAGGVSANYVAKWDAASGAWTNLGAGMNSHVYALAHDGLNLYAGGWFTYADRNPAKRVAKWDVASGAWSNLGSGVSNAAGRQAYVYDLAYDGTNLYVGGAFTTAGGVPANYVAKWDAATGSWTNLGAGMDSDVYALAHDGANLYAGGWFTTAGGVRADYVAKRDAASGAWTNLGAGMDDGVYALAQDGTNLYAGGYFTTAGGVWAKHVAKWGPAVTVNPGVSPASGAFAGGYTVTIIGSNLGNGSDITNVTIGGVKATVLPGQSATQVVVTAGAAAVAGLGDVRVFSTSFGETVKSNAFAYCQLSANTGPFAGGNTITITNGTFGNITNVLVGGVRATLGARGTTWFTITLPATGAAGVKDIVVQTSDNGDITLAGAYTVNPAGWIGGMDNGPSAWTNLGAGIGGPVSAVTYDGMNLYAGGRFATAGGVSAANVAKWDAASGTWTNLGDGMNNDVRALAYDGTNLYAGGYFTTAGGVSANYVAKWDAASGAWTNLGVGMDGEVFAFAYDGTNLYAGGYFMTAGGKPAANVAKWDAASGAWTNLGTGLNDWVRALAYDGTNLYAGGDFTTAGGVPANYVAKWDAAAGTWTNLGAGMNSAVHALAHDGTNLYAGGMFTTAGGVAANYVAKWDAASGAWTNLGAGMDNMVYALAHDGVNLYACGWFKYAGGVRCNYVAKWDAASGAWTNLGAGMDDGVYALAHDGMNLYAGGDFTTAGGVAANRMAKWGPTVTENPGVSPASGSWAGGYTVTIIGSSLGNGSDITNVTICGVKATVLPGQSATQVVVTAGVSGAAGPGDVRVFSTSFGETVKSNAFEYLRAAQASLVFLPASPQAYATTNALSVSGGSGTGAVSYVVRSGPGRMAEVSKLTVLSGTGSVVVVAAKAADSLYSALSATATVTCAKAAQAITFANPGAQLVTNIVTLAATASSGLPVSFALQSGAAGLYNSSNLAFGASSIVTVVASQAGDTNWNAATSVTQSFAVLNVITALTDKAEVTVPEGGTATFRVKLSAQVTDDVVVAVARDSGDADLSVLSGASLTFTPVNWSTYQTVTLAAAEEDNDNANGTAVFAITAAGITSAKVIATEADDDYTLTVTATNGTVAIGSFDKDPRQKLYDDGTVVTLTATPDERYQFIEWFGDATGTTNPLALTMDGDKVVTAWFAPVAPLALPPRAIARKSFTARWRWVDGGAPEGQLSVASDAGFVNPVPGYASRYLCNLTECVVTNLTADRDYWYRVRRLTVWSGPSGWSKAVKVRTGVGLPVFTSLLCAAPVGSGSCQEFALTNLVAGSGALTVKSSDTNSVTVMLTTNALFLHYLWKDTGTSARVTVTVRHPDTGYKSAYEAVLSEATGKVVVVEVGALTNAGKRLVQEVTLENQTGGLVFGVRLRAAGLDHAIWMTSRTGVTPYTLDPYWEAPCVWPPGSQLVVRASFHADYAKQARTRPVEYWAGAVLPPVNGTEPITTALPIVRSAEYEDGGLWLLGLPALGNRWYAVLQSDDDGASWVTNVPAVRATANYLMWLDLVAGTNRLYEVKDLKK